MSPDGAVDKNSTHFGFIAQEVEGQFPELVGRASDGMRSVQYSAFVPLIIEGMKGQRAEAAAQRKMQRAEMDALRARVDRVSTVVSVKGLTGTGAVTGPLDHLISVKGLSGTGAVTAHHDLFSGLSSAAQQSTRSQAADAHLMEEVGEAYEKVASILRRDMRTSEIAHESRHMEHDAKELALKSEITALKAENAKEIAALKAENVKEIAALRAENAKLSGMLAELKDAVAMLLKSGSR